MHLGCFIAGKLPSCELSEEVEAEESYFGGTRKGKRNGAASVKVVVFGLLKRGGLAAIAPNARTETLLSVLEEKVTTG